MIKIYFIENLLYTKVRNNDKQPTYNSSTLKVYQVLYPEMEHCSERIIMFINVESAVLQKKKRFSQTYKKQSALFFTYPIQKLCACMKPQKNLLKSSNFV